MEITINNKEESITKTNKPYFKVTFNGDRKASVFNENDVAMMRGVAIGMTIDCDVKQKGNYTNLENVRIQNQSVNQSANPSLPPIPVFPKENLRSARDNIIIAQVVLKEANNHISAHIEAGLEFDASKYGEWLCECVNELVGAYEVALKRLDE